MKFFYYLVSKLPIKVLYVFSDFFYVFISRFYRKKVVETNIKNSFPDLSGEQYKKIKKRFYKNFCDIFFETIKSYSIKKWKYSKDIFLTNQGEEREAPNEGEVFIQKDLYNTLKKLVETKKDSLNFLYDVLLGIRSHKERRSKMRPIARILPKNNWRRKYIKLIHKTRIRTESK